MVVKQSQYNVVSAKVILFWQYRCMAFLNYNIRHNVHYLLTSILDFFCVQASMSSVSLKLKMALLLLIYWLDQYSKLVFALPFMYALFQSMSTSRTKSLISSQNEEKRNLSLGGHVGFDSLPDQLVSKSVTQGFCFNILCVGKQLLTAH